MDKILRLPFINMLATIVLCAITIWGTYIASSLYLSPEPYTIENVGTQSYTLCSGDNLVYKSLVTVRKVPITLIRTDSWFSVDTNSSATHDDLTTAEIYNWDSKVRNTVPKERSVKVPYTLENGKPLPPGNYRYIVHLNSFGVSSPASMSVEVHVPKSCKTIDHK